MKAARGRLKRRYREKSQSPEHCVQVSSEHGCAQFVTAQAQKGFAVPQVWDSTAAAQWPALAMPVCECVRPVPLQQWHRQDDE